MDISSVLFKTQFIVQGKSEIFEALHHVNSFIIDAGGVVGCAVCAGSVDDQFLCLCYIQLQVIVHAPLCEVLCEGRLSLDSLKQSYCH